MAFIDNYFFPFDEDTVLVRDTARRFAIEEVAPLASKIDKEHYFPKELIPKLGALGFLGVCVPSEYGGAGLTQVAYCLIIEELSAACASTGVIVSAHNSLCIDPILHFGTDEQKQRFLPDLASGKKLGCFCLSEPGAGSDAAGITTTAVKKGDKYIINGSKNWITNGPVAGITVLFAKHDVKSGHEGISAFIVPLDVPGVTIGKYEDKLGICGSPTSSITFEDVEIPLSNLLYQENKGFKVAMTTLNGGRTGIAAQAVGIGRAALKVGLEYSKQRKAFGQVISNHQSIQNYLADMITELDAARLLTLSAAKLKDEHKPFIRQAAMAKLFASEMALKVADKSLQIHGGYGYVKEFSAERHFRDSKITQIYEGTSEIQRLVIAGQLLREME